MGTARCFMFEQYDSSTRDAEIDVTVRSDSKVIPNARWYRNLSLGCHFHGVTLACITCGVKSPNVEMSGKSERQAYLHALVSIYFLFLQLLTLKSNLPNIF